MNYFQQVIWSCLYLLLYLVVLMGPGFLVFGTIYWRRYHKIRRRKLIVTIFSLLGTLLAPMSVYVFGYRSSNGWHSDAAVIFVAILLYLPFILVGFFVGFYILGRIKERASKQGLN